LRRETGARWRVAALNADAIKFYTVHFTHKVEYFYGQMMKAADNSISGYGEIRRRRVCVRWIRAELAEQIPLLGTSEFLPACIYMMERTISFMHDLPDNSLAQRRAWGVSLALSRKTYLLSYIHFLLNVHSVQSRVSTLSEGFKTRERSAVYNIYTALHVISSTLSNFRCALSPGLVRRGASLNCRQTNDSRYKFNQCVVMR
jgi:hypothetical protein